MAHFPFLIFIFGPLPLAGIPPPFAPLPFFMALAAVRMLQGSLLSSSPNAPALTHWQDLG